ncbi:hypothetical protein BDF20DRAFT_588548 [Mycotypha africana]|uniref:uncharacterized protein n=1 Tax=Mycotypha africana TaxID=64632 RepID=UPI0022FFF3ED|nr:uncharacterized protein BDF20DRAFT_588548 [Mycotypha africana]KAI8975142.1 hypothetical protein BDF20DRAFT_588548 [Mycotypha africana]
MLPPPLLVRYVMLLSKPLTISSSPVHPSFPSGPLFFAIPFPGYLLDTQALLEGLQRLQYPSSIPRSEATRFFIILSTTQYHIGTAYWALHFDNLPFQPSRIEITHSRRHS